MILVRVSVIFSTNNLTLHMPSPEYLLLKVPVYFQNLVFI